MSITNRSRKVADGAMKISIAAMPSASLLRKLRQVGDGVRGRQHVLGNRRLTDLDTEVEQLAMVRGAPQSGLA